MKATAHIVLFTLLTVSTAATASVSPTQNPIAKAAKLAPIENVERLVVESQRDEELPLACRGYYVRPHRASTSGRCN